MASPASSRAPCLVSRVSPAILQTLVGARAPMAPRATMQPWGPHQLRREQRRGPLKRLFARTAMPCSCRGTLPRLLGLLCWWMHAAMPSRSSLGCVGEDRAAPDRPLPSCQCHQGLSLSRVVTDLVLDAVDEAQGRQLMRATDSLCALLRLPFFGEVRFPGVRPLLLALGLRHTCALSMACHCCRTSTCLKYV